ncbi:MAG TPA: polyprenyl synthetase family protein [Thermoanaerobaculia bacterium]|nr:polyprenyl synthetase family protein [Thermoanaerobaculia bacterium]
MKFELIKARIRTLPEVAAWPQMVDVVERAVHREGRSIWDYPFAASLAVGGTEEAALPGGAAVFCAMASIHLVDDILDEDPEGDYRRLGTGPAANLALAFQAAAHRVLDSPTLPIVTAETRAALQESLAGMALATAFGQNLDTRPLRSEEEYWQVLEAKTPPLFGMALYVGALLGGAPQGVAESLQRLGHVMGRFIQVSDDLSDALKTPAGADWRRRFHNLPILYAMTAEHPERDEFLHLATRAGNPAALAAAQKILLRSGAVSYCALKLIELSQQARQLLGSLPLADPGPVARLLEHQIKPLRQLFESMGVDEPAALTVEWAPEWALECG